VFALVGHFALTRVAFISDPVLLASDRELVEVGVRPTHNSLQDPVEFAEGDVASDLDPRPEEWMRAAEGNLELVDLNWF
jgi:hypothetical protein